MLVNSIKTKNNFHNYIVIKQSDNTSAIELLLCGANGSILSDLNQSCTLTILDEVDKMIRQKTTEQIFNGTVTFRVTNDLKTNPHTLEITTDDGQKFPSNHDFKIFVSYTHDESELKIINNLSRDEALAEIGQSVKQFISENTPDFIDKEATAEWLKNNKFKPKEAVESFSELPKNAELKEIRLVQDANKQYIFDGEQWIEFGAVNLDGLNNLKTDINTVQSNLGYMTMQVLADNVVSSTKIYYLDNIGDGWIYGASSKSLYRKSKVSDSWQLVYTFSSGDAITGLRQLGDGEVIIARSTDGMWKSTGWATNPLTATWRQVLVTNGRVTQFSFDVDKVSGWVSVTTYINGDMTNSRYVWLSKDNGNSFNQIMDMLTFEPTIDKTHSHFHTASLDPYVNPSNPRIWVSYHKTNADPTNNAAPIKRIKYSDDGGQNWVNFSDANYQPTVARATKYGMLFASDEELVGLYKVDRKSNPAEMKYEPFYFIRDKLNGIFGWGVKSIKDDLGNYHFAFRSSVAGIAARIISTDGINVNTTLEIKGASNENVDIVNITHYEGKMFVTYILNGTSSMWHHLVAELPKRGIKTDDDIGGLSRGFASALGVAAGYNSKASQSGTAYGSNSLADLHGTAIGESANSGYEGTAIGSSSSATGNGVAFGKGSTTDNGVSLGRNSVSAGDSTSVGATAKSVDSATSIGAFAYASNAQALALGKQATASGQYSISIGALSSAPAADTGRIFFRKNGTGVMELCAMFPSGKLVVLASDN